MSIDFAAIKANVNMVELASQYTELKHISGDEYCGPCPWCSGDDRFRVFHDHFFCRPGAGHCGRKGSAIDFIMEMKQVDAKDAASILAGGNLVIDGAPLKPVAHPQNGQVKKVWDAEERARQKAMLLESHEQLLRATAKGAQQCLAYLEGRGITLHTITAFKLGYRAVNLPDSEQKELAIAIPWFNQAGELVSIKYRFLQEHSYTGQDGKPKTATKTSRQSPKDRAFGWHALRNSKTLLIIEGEINAMSVHQVIDWDVLSLGSMQMFKALPDEVIALAEKYDQVVVWTDELEFTRAAAKKLGARVMNTQQDANELLQAGKLTEVLQDQAVEKPKTESSEYDVVDGCIGEWKERKNRKGEVEETYFVPLCNFNAWIVADVAADDGEEITRKIALAGQLASGQALPEIEINADEFEAMKWAVAKWGARVSISPDDGAIKRLRHAIQQLSENRMIDRRTLTHTGWTVINGKRVFLHAGGALGAEGVSVNLPRNLANYYFPSDDAIDPVTAMRESIKLLDIAPARVSSPIWAAMYLGPLSELITPVFTISIEGASGSLKSSYSAVQTNHYGWKFNEYAMPADWLATVNSLEKLCFHAKDVPLIIDDYRPSTNPAEARQLQEAVSRIVRAAGNRQGRNRLDSNSEFKRTFAPRGVVIMTAERKALGKSVNSRILTVDVEPGDINPKLLAEAQKQRHVYAYAMRGYIESIAKDWDELSTALPAKVADLRAGSSGNGHHLRLPNATAILQTAFECAMSYAVEIGAISKSEADRRSQACATALANMAESQNQATEEEDPAHKFMSIIASLIMTDRAYLSAKTEKGDKGLSNLGLAISEKLGWHDGRTAYLMPTAYNTVCRYAQAEGWTFPSDENTLRKELDRSGYIAKKDEDKLTTLQRVPGDNTRVRVTAVSYQKLSAILAEMGYTPHDSQAEGNKS